MDSFDLVVIGSGTAATTVATITARAGWKVALADFRPLGGTCALRGCDPKKVLMAGGQAVDLANRLQGKGVRGRLAIDWPALMAFKRGFTDPVAEHTEERLRKAGVEVLHGRARFIGSLQIDVAGRTLQARRVVLAIGAEPVKLGIPGEQHLATSEDFMSLPQLPRRVVFVGGGYIAAEFSHLAARAGAQVTVLQHGDRLLKQFDPDLVGLLTRHMTELGIAVHVRTQVEAVDKHGDGFVVHASHGSESVSFEADLVVHAAGRKPDLAALSPAGANIEVHDGRLALDEHLRSKSSAVVYAAGDAAQHGPPLTPVASLDAQMVAHNLLHGDDPRKPDYRGVPSVAFTLPPIAAVGLGEEQARRQGLRFQVRHAEAGCWYTARRVNERVYAFKILVEEGSDLLLGAHLIGPRADETINLFALAIRHGLTAEELKSAVFAYPTAASDLHHML
jgi:glutathione reductase (NADPH)